MEMKTPVGSATAPVVPRRWLAYGAAVSLLAAVVSTYPLATRLHDSIADCTSGPGRCGDNLLCVWIVGEGGRRLYTDVLHVFEANIFHPLRHTLAYSESLLSAGAFVAPLNALTGNPILGYNVYFLASYALSAFGTFLLVLEMTRDPRAGLLAGWLCALADERWWFGGRLPTLSVHWVPFVFWTWIRMLDRPSLGRALALFAALLVHEHASAYYALMLPLLLVPWALTLFLAGPWQRQAWLRTGGVALCAVIVGLGVYLPYLAVHAEVPHQPMALPTAMRIQRYWAGVGDLPGELWMPLQGPRLSVNASPLPLLVVAMAAVVARLRPAFIAAPPTQGAYVLAFSILWLAAAIVSCDPLVAGVPGLFGLIQKIPGFASMRAPDRFVVLASFAGCVVMGLAGAVLLRRVRSRSATAVLVLGLAALAVLDTRILREPMPLRRLPAPDDVPAVYRWLATTDPDTAVWELPESLDDDAMYMVHSLYHGRRLVNGYSAIVPRLFHVRPDFLNESDVRALQAAGVSYVILHADALARTRYGDALLRTVSRRRDLSQRWLDAALVVEIPPDGHVASQPRGSELDRGAWRLEGSTPGAMLAADGDLATHWTPEPGARESFLRVELPSRAWITGITLRLGPHILEFPRGYTIWVSDDALTWKQIGGETGTVPPLASYRHDHLDVELPLRIDAAPARFVEIRVPARSAPFRLWSNRPAPSWGVHELRIYAGGEPRG